MRYCGAAGCSDVTLSRVGRCELAGVVGVVHRGDVCGGRVPVCERHSVRRPVRAVQRRRRL